MRTVGGLLGISASQARAVAAIFKDGRPQPIVRAQAVVDSDRGLEAWSAALKRVRHAKPPAPKMPLTQRELDVRAGLAEATHVRLWERWKVKADKEARATLRKYLISTAAAAALLGISVAQLDRLSEPLGLQVAGTYQNPHYRSGPPARLWDIRQVRKLKRRKAVMDARARKGGATKKNRDAEFVERYGTPAAALPDACDAVFNLNRYTRHPTCADAHKREIWDLKSRLIQHLYQLERYTDRVECLTRTLPRKVCWDCDGTGQDFEEDDRCMSCGGSGDFQPERVVNSYVFSFTVGQQRYTWIQPDHAMTFVPKVEATRVDDGARVVLETEMNIQVSDLAAAKALVKYALGL